MLCSFFEYGPLRAPDALAQKLRSGLSYAWGNGRLWLVGHSNASRRRHSDGATLGTSRVSGLEFPLSKLC
ncbi:unnamed protein product [Rodentolepis nana]|uniref:Uncharacterized protein n=1 Tax=Rodentolepis nana TaxID=102285 RepID=A0A0R3TF51_RODNA|nr:unnamed protein product [Rodentolepis nana]